MPVNVLWDPDFWTDVDDVLAGVMLCYGFYRRFINPIAIGISATLANSAPALDGLLKTYGLTNVPIGVPAVPFVPSGTPSYQATLRARTAHLVDPNRVYENAVTMYRRALARTQRVTDAVCTGYLNNFSQLLDSPADSISPLTGQQLIEQKIRRLIDMGGTYPSGSENNYNRAPAARVAANNVVARWPTPIVYSGFEVGVSVISGGNLRGLQATNIVAQALLDHGSPNGRSSWDPMSMLLQFVASPAQGGYTTVRGSNAVNASTGANVFTPNANGRDVYTIKALPDAVYAAKMNALLLPENWPTTSPGFA